MPKGDPRVAKKRRTHHPHFDFEKARQNRDEALERVERGADPEWVDRARAALIATHQKETST
jgi:hypothetical protein